MARARILLAAVAWSVIGPAAIAAESRNVLVLYSNNRLVPGNVAVDRGLNATINATDRPHRIFSEFLDRPDFSGDAYEATMVAYLRDKYASQPPDAVMSVSDEAFEFLMRHRAELYPDVPLVHTVVSRSFLQTFPPRPSNVIGVPIEYDYSGTIEQALRWHPGARRLIIVTGASQRDRQREARLRREVPAVAGALPVEYLAELPTPAVLQRLAALDADSVVFTPGYFRDGEGRPYSPRDSAALMAAASAAPVYGPADTFIGTGVVGGRMPSFEAMGREGGRILNELFAGTPPAALQLPALAPTAVEVDWRQVRRWGIDEARIPPDAIVHFRSASFWEAYRNEALVAAAVVLLQAALIAALLIERTRRRAAQVVVAKQRTELAHASRLAVAGELTASIAHEINQPLGAVQTSADAADLILQFGGDRRDDLLRIVTRIRRDNLRASDVIRRLRALLARHEPEQLPFDLNVVLGDVATFLAAEARQRSVALDVRPAAASVYVLGDQTQMQQVVINLIINAMDTVADLPDDRRVVVVTAEASAGQVAITVRDRGHGIAAEHLSKLFDSFFSTKLKGMGLGLSIARTIVEAHGGRIWAASVNGEGAELHVELPTLETARASAPITA